MKRITTIIILAAILVLVIGILVIRQVAARILFDGVVRSRLSSSGFIQCHSAESSTAIEATLSMTAFTF